MKLRSKKAYIAVGSTLMVCLIVIVGFVIINKKQSNIFVNIDDLEPEYVEKYFDDYEKLNKKNDKSNILIVTTKKKLKDTYGATDVVNAPNNQYFLQYSSEEEKNRALEKFNKEEPDMDVSENTVSEISEDTVLVSNYNSWGVEAMGIDTLLDEFQGKELNDVTVAIVDTGLDVDVFNASFAGRLAGTYNVLENNDNMYDNNGHGTHIAGTIAESTPSSVKILPVKVSDTKNIYETDTITAINYVTYNKNADVMNMSFGSAVYSQGEYIAIEAARQNNIISVAAAGNENSSNSSYPASFDNTISIAAVDSSKTKASFSNYGDGIMFSTPGVDIKSIASKEENRVMSGTSMATPHAVSAIANLKSLNKNLAYDNIVTILRRYSDDLGDIGWDEYYGYGFINFKDAKVCDGTDCDEYNVFKKSSRDNLDEVITGYEIEPVLTTYNYGSVNNILNTKVNLKFSNGKIKEYKLYDITNLEMSDYDPYSLEKQTISIKFTTSIGFKVEGSFDVTNPAEYESVWEYQNVGDNNIELTGFKDTSFTNTLLYFPSVIDGYSVTGIADRDTSMFLEAKDSFIKVRKIFLPSSIVKVGNKAFYMAGTISGINVVKSYADNLSVGDYAFMGVQSLYDLEASISYVGDYAFAYTMSLSDFTFSDNITHIGNRAFQSSFTEGIITIPESVTEIGESAFIYSGLKEIKFLNKMETIPSQMMQGNLYLEKVTLPEGLKEIGSNAFSGNTKLNTINLPNSLTTIGNNAFAGSFNGGKLVIPKNVTLIGTNALKATGLTEVEFLNKMETIPSQMMYNSSNLERVVLPEGLKEIGESAFYLCDKLNTINLPNSLTTIGNNAFGHAFDSSKDTTIVIPESVTSLGSLAFSESGLKEAIVLGNTLSISMFNGSKNLEKVTLPETLIEIPNYAFENCKNLKTINLPENLYIIGDGSFKGCESLSSLNLPETVMQIGESAYSGAFKTTNDIKITIPRNVTVIGKYAFEKTNIKEVEFLNSIAKIPVKMFQYNNNLEKVVLPDRIKEIDDNAFYNCKKLKTINLPDSLTTLGYSVFGYSFDPDYNTKITIPESVTSIDTYTFAWSNIKEVTILSDIKTLPSNTFYSTSKLEKVTLPETITEIGDSAFEYSNLKIFNFSKNLKRIGSSAFEESNIENANLPDGVTEIDDSAFRGCKKLQTINLPDSLTTLDYSVFESAFDPDYDTKITIPKSVTSIGKYIFEYSNVKEVTILSDIETLPSSAFYKASKLEKVVLPSKLVKLDGYDFTDCTSLKSIYFDKNISSIVDDRNVFGGLKDTLTFYVYSNTVPKTYAKSKNINYVQIDPDTIDVKNIKSKYSAFEKVNIDDVSLELTYDEKTTRKETISNNIEIVYPDSREDFRYGDTSIKVIAYNERGYKVEKDVNVEVVKATPKYTVPKNLTAEIGQKLYDISLPENFAWTSDNVTFDKNGRYKFTATYTPTDLTNYEVVNNIEITVNVGDVSSLYTITYNSNDENGLTSTQEVEENVKTKLNKNTFTRDGYEFVGWNTKTDGKGIAYTDEQEVSIKDDLVLYAQWEKVNTDITFDANGGTVSIDSMKIPDDGYYGELPIPYKENAGFVNWACKSDGTMVSYSDEVSCTELVAVWVDNAYTFILDANGGTLSALFDNSGSYLRINSRELLSSFFLNNNKYTIDKNMFVRNDKTFKEWNTKADGSGKTYFEGELIGKDDVVLENNTFKLYAIWEDYFDYRIKDYYVDETNHYISKIMAGTSGEDFKKKIEHSERYGVEVDTKNIDGKEVMYTGGKTRIYQGGNVYVTYTNIVIGDVNGDGAINSADLLRIRQHLLGSKYLRGENFLASDINYDSDINSADLLRVRQHLLGTKTIS